VPKKAQITQERVEYNIFLFDESPKGSKSLKIFKISLTFRFDKLSNLSKSVHIGENSQILTVSNKKKFNVHLCQKVPWSSAAPRPKNPDSDEKDALFGLDTQFCGLHVQKMFCEYPCSCASVRRLGYAIPLTLAKYHFLD
jgi:hypothetical protein